MYYITGDTHRDFRAVMAFCNQQQTTTDDVLIILGDVGINYFGGKEDAELKQALARLPITLFCVHGNHEMRPRGEIRMWSGYGVVKTQPEFPNIMYALDTNIYDFGGMKCFVLGGAYSVDKQQRLANGYGWWEDEQPDGLTKIAAKYSLMEARWDVDCVLTHTCPLKYVPHESFNQDDVDNSTEWFLDELEDVLQYNKWYCGHFHIDKTIDNMRFVAPRSFILLGG